METHTSFRKAFGDLWRSGFAGKLFLALSIFLMLGLLDAGPRYVRYFGVLSGITQTTAQPVELPPNIAQYTLVSYEDRFARDLEACVTRVRDSLLASGVVKSNSAPQGYAMLALRPDFQISDAERPLDSTQLLIFLDARLECDCETDGFFRLVRFIIDPDDFSVSVLRDEQVSWYAYLGKNLPKLT